MRNRCPREAAAENPRVVGLRTWSLLSGFAADEKRMRPGGPVRTRSIAPAGCLGAGVVTLGHVRLLGRVSSEGWCRTWGRVVPGVEGAVDGRSAGRAPGRWWWAGGGPARNRWTASR